jgi:hypothetical protein
VVRYPNPEERRQLRQLIRELFERNRADFRDEEEVFRLFVTAVLRGRLLPLARLIERTYGPGSFRRLGEDEGPWPGEALKPDPAMEQRAKS